ncbi:MAG TPA: phenylalanine--tRNA ligase subunit beta, partial [Myxococcaceae bacterium]|nr:phenylalanine--tRNA ligase subunit beta [Myxococcaceae bacterium]
MKISLNWLMEYVPVSLAPEALADRLTMAGLEVEGIAHLAERLENVRVARVVESSPHPNAEKLSVAKVDAGDGRVVQIVCGAKNYQVGDKVPLASPGARLPNGMEIRETAIRGVDSFGMLCSAKELGLSDDASGLLILDPQLREGTPLAQAIGLDDIVLEVNVTPNRPDALSHIGLAREVGALTSQAVRARDPELTEGRTSAAESARVRIEDPDRCPRYAARVIE